MSLDDIIQNAKEMAVEREASLAIIGKAMGRNKARLGGLKMKEAFCEAIGYR